MRRIISALAGKEYDLVIIGGGIYGASVARDAALRGLTVALVDRADFGSGTSANSHKIIHGGLRYLQHADFKRMRESIRERSTLLRIAPHLVRTMPVLVPIYRDRGPGKLVMSLALRMNDLISLDRNRYLQAAKAIARGRVIARAECLRLCPGLNERGLTGGAIFYDGQVYNPERLTLAILLSASKEGADLANYLRAIGFLRNQDRIIGIRAQDMLTGETLDIRARIVVNCSGPWIDRVLDPLRRQRQQATVGLLKAVVLVTRPLTHGVAVGVQGRYPYKDIDAVVNKGHRYFLITPWRNASLVGTFQLPFEAECDKVAVTEQEIESCIIEINTAYAAANITREDVRFLYVGLLPRADHNGKPSDIQLLKQYKIVDHGQSDDIQGLISVVGVKYTTARDVAEKVVDLILMKFGKKRVPSSTAFIPVCGGELERHDYMHDEDLQGEPRGVSREVIRHLIQTYGSEYPSILQYGEDNPDWLQPISPGSLVTMAEVVHGVRAEMAQKLGDVILRRTELGTAGYPGDLCLQACAEIMAEELHWSEAKTRCEIDETRSIFEKLGCISRGPREACASL